MTIHQFIQQLARQLINHKKCKTWKSAAWKGEKIEPFWNESQVSVILAVFNVLSSFNLDQRSKLTSIPTFRAKIALGLALTLIQDLGSISPNLTLVRHLMFLSF